MGQGAMVQGVIDGSGSNGRINGWRKQRLWEQSKEHEWFRQQSKEHEWYKRWINDAWMQAMGQGTIEGTMNGSDSNRRSDGSVSNGRSDEECYDVTSTSI